MAIRVQNLPEKTFDKGGPPLSLPNFNVNYPSWWMSNEQQVPLSLSSNVSFKAKSAPKKGNHETKNLGFKLVDQDSSSTQSVSISQSRSRDQSISSESGQDESCSRSVEGQIKPVFLYGNNSPEGKFDPSHSDPTHQMVHVAYPPTNPYFSGLMAAYGPPAIIQPQMGSQAVGVPPTRVPLPLNLPEDGPIYVNAKQYRGILRRRQSRAKLEAQNKLVKNRKPYLHESRHRHALNRVRGSGGRFLSTKKLQQQASTQGDLSGQNNHRSQGNDLSIPGTACLEMTSMSGLNTFHHPDMGVSGICPVERRRNGGALLDASGLRSSSVW